MVQKDLAINRNWYFSG